MKLNPTFESQPRLRNELQQSSSKNFKKWYCAILLNKIEKSVRVFLYFEFFLTKLRVQKSGFCGSQIGVQTSNYQATNRIKSVKRYTQK